MAESKSSNTGGICTLVTHEAESTATLMRSDERIFDVKLGNG